MSSRGSVAENGHVLTNEYETVYVTKLGVKVLKGIGEKHSLPDFAHTKNSIYAKVEKDGTLREMRFYNDEGWPIIEIAYHAEKNLDKSGKKVVHYHLYGGLNRDDAKLLTSEIKAKYKEYLKEFNLYDKC